VEYDPRTLRLRFAIADFTEANASAVSVPVDFTGIKPDMFADGRDVIVEGKYTSGVLQANQVLTSCPSKYEAKTAEAGPAAAKGES
jgi:cytochrome c-type biogenesis protein CcmE